MNVAELILERAQRHPAAIAYAGVHGMTATYADLAKAIDHVARRVQSLGVGAGATAAIGTSDLYRYVVMALALARLGVAHAPSFLPAHKADIAFLDAGMARGEFARVVTIDELGRSDTMGREPPTPLAAHEGGAATFMLCPSSGTTGVRKFVPVSHDLVLRRVAVRVPGTAAMAAGGVASAVRQACLVAPGSSYGFSSVLVVLNSGGTVLEPCLDAGELPGWLVQSRVNFIIASPIQLQKVLDVLPDFRGPNSLAAIEVGGGALTASLYALAQRRLCGNLFINYGSTECGRVAGAPAATLAGKPGAVGYPYPDVEIEIVDEEDRPVAVGGEGVIRIRSKGNAAGFIDDPEGSAAIFRNGWVYPGDRGILDADGLLHIVGRADDVINRGGLKINPQAVEDAMMTLADLREVAVFGVVDAAGLAHVLAAVVPTTPIDGEAFHARCRERLGDAAPEIIMHMQELPRNSNGKVLRQELIRMAVEAGRAQRAAAAGATVH